MADTLPATRPAAAPTPKRTRWVFVDILNLLACFAVIMLHVTLNVFHPENTLTWVRAVTIQSVFIYAVPIFFMISGMNLLNYRRNYSTGVFFRKRLLRVGRALLGGSIICYLIFIAFPHSFYGAEDVAAHPGLRDFAHRFLANQINEIYWFFYAIIYLYVLTPIISWAARDRDTLRYFLALLAFVGVALPQAVHLGLNRLFVTTSFNWMLFSFVPVLYFVAGYYIKTYWRPTRIHGVIALVGFAACAIAMTLLSLHGNGYFSPAGVHAQYDTHYNAMESPLGVVQGICLFVAVLSFEPQPESCRS